MVLWRTVTGRLWGELWSEAYAWWLLRLLILFGLEAVGIALRRLLRWGLEMARAAFIRSEGWNIDWKMDRDVQTNKSIHQTSKFSTLSHLRLLYKHGIEELSMIQSIFIQNHFQPPNKASVYSIHLTPFPTHHSLFIKPPNHTPSQLNPPQCSNLPLNYRLSAQPIPITI